jgi:hypothetical protein
MFEITYGTGKINGELASETVQIGNQIIKNQVFGAVTNE